MHDTKNFFKNLPSLSYFKNVQSGHQTSFRLRTSSADSANNTPLVFLHGFNGSSKSWAHQFAHFTDRTVLAIDAPGFGKSDVLDNSMATTAEEIAALMHYCGITRAVVVGHSMGGMLAQVFGATHQDICAGIFLSCTHKGRAQPSDAPLSAEVEERIRQRSELDDSTYGDIRVRKMLTGEIVVDNLAFLAAIAGDIDVAGIQAGALAMQFLDTTPLLDDIRAPVAILTAENDIVVKPEAAAALTAGLPQAHRFHLAGVGHAPYCEDVTGFNRALEDFIMVCQKAMQAS